MFATNVFPDDEMQMGELVAFQLKERSHIPIVQRIIKVHHGHHDATNESNSSLPGSQHLLLTKGDDNRVDDRELYPPGQMWLERRDVTGKVAAVLPFVGMIFIILRDYSFLQYGTMILTLFVGRFRRVGFTPVLVISISFLASFCYA